MSFCAWKTVTLAPELQVSVGQRPHLCFFHAKQRLYDQTYKSVGVPALTCGFVHAKQRLLEQNYKYLCVPVLICGFCIHNSAFWTRISSLYGSQTSSVVWAYITACLTQEYKDYMCSSPRLWFCACKTATLALELLVSMGPSPHLCFLLAKQRLLDQNNKSPLVPDITCRFVHAIQRD